MYKFLLALCMMFLFAVPAQAEPASMTSVYTQKTYDITKCQDCHLDDQVLHASINTNTSRWQSSSKPTMIHTKSKRDYDMKSTATAKPNNDGISGGDPIGIGIIRL